MFVKKMQVSRKSILWKEYAEETAQTVAASGKWVWSPTKQDAGLFFFFLFKFLY